MDLILGFEVRRRAEHLTWTTRAIADTSVPHVVLQEIKTMQVVD
jgi:hypothetical protein